MNIFDGPIDFEATKNRAIRRAMREGAAVHIELLAEQTKTILPDDALFTKEEVIALLEGFVLGLRNNDT